jgi:hypothetical protein
MDLAGISLDIDTPADFAVLSNGQQRPWQTVEE